MNRLSLDLENSDGEDDRELEEWDPQRRPPTTTTWASTSSTRPPRRTFASRHKQQTARPPARKALNLGSEPPPLKTADESLAFLVDHTDNKRQRKAAAALLKQQQDEENLENQSNSFSRRSSSFSRRSSSSVSSPSSSPALFKVSQSPPSLPKHVPRSTLSRSKALPPPIPPPSSRLNSNKNSRPAPVFERSWSLTLGSNTPAPHRLRENYSSMKEALETRGGEDELASPSPWERHSGSPEHAQSSPNLPEEEPLLDDHFSARGRKKHRGRRASIQGSVPSLESVFLKRMENRPALEQLTPPAPPPLHTRSLSTCSSPSNPRSLSEVLGDVNGSSPRSNASSRASSGRKRGVCGSPISDHNMDDSCSSLREAGRSASFNSATSSVSARRRRSRRALLPPSVPVPASLDAALSLEPALGNKLQEPSKAATKSRRARNRRKVKAHECRGMEHCDSTDDDLDMISLDSHDHDTSFAKHQQELNHSVPVVTISTKTTSEKQAADIFQTMSSYEDLKHVIRELRKEAGEGQRAPVNFGRQKAAAIWTVSPGPGWDSARRSRFFHWLISQFQFTMRSLGNAVNVLSISRSKGELVLAKLKQALVDYKESTVATNFKPAEMANEHQSPNTPFGMVVKSRHAPGSNQPRTNHSTVAAPLFGSVDEADELADGLQTLTMAEVQNPVPDEALVVAGRPSFDSVAPSLRPSMEHSVGLGANDMMLHLHGHESPENQGRDDGEDHVRPPKLSLASVTSANSRNRQSAPLAPIQTIELMETPQIKSDEGWGSRPVAGKDWGESMSCSKATLEELWRLFDETGRIAGVRESLESCGGLPIMPGELDFEDVDGNEDLNEAMREDQDDGRQERRLNVSYAKHQRMSLWAAAAHDLGPLLPERKSAFPVHSRASVGPVDEFTSLHEYEDSFPIREVSQPKLVPTLVSWEQVVSNESLLRPIFSFLSESDLLCTASLVSTTWANAATTAHAELMMASVGYNDEDAEAQTSNDDDHSVAEVSAVVSMDRDWGFLTRLFPWACFLSSGAFKRVFKVYNSAVRAEEAVSIMDVDRITDKKTVASELVVTSMLSAMARRGICPNFVIMRGVFTLPYDVPASHWGCENNKKPKGAKYAAGKKIARPRQPKTAYPGRYQFIRMELCGEGDLEEFLKRQDSECLHPEAARRSLFQIAFALNAAAERYSLKHYDIKLLNIFVQGISSQGQGVVLRYGLGSHVFSLNMPSDTAFFAKLADYGTANIQAKSTGQPVTIAQFTTLENTPPDYMILGDEARQGHGHDNFGLGLAMLHLFTGSAPYEELLQSVVCPLILKKKLKSIWENDNEPDYSVIRSIILADVYKDERGHILDGEPDEVLYDTLYRFLVLFGIPETKYEQRRCPSVWKAITEALEAKITKNGRRQKQGTAVTQFEKDCQKYSVRYGSNFYIARARESLQAIDGGMELLFQLCDFNPKTRATALHVLNSPFMASLRESPAAQYGSDVSVHSFTAFSTHR